MKINHKFITTSNRNSLWSFLYSVFTFQRWLRWEKIVLALENMACYTCCWALQLTFFSLKYFFLIVQRPWNKIAILFPRALHLCYKWTLFRLTCTFVIHTFDLCLRNRKVINNTRVHWVIVILVFISCAVMFACVIGEFCYYSRECMQFSLMLVGKGFFFYSLKFLMEEPSFARYLW